MDQNQSQKQRPPVTEETEQATATAHEDTPSTPSPAKASTAKARPAPKAEASAPKASASKPKSEKSAPAVRTSTTADAPKKVAKEAPKAPAKEKAAASAQVGIRSERPAHRVIPYLLLLLAAFLLVCLTLNLFCNLDNQLADDPSAHWMGRIGYHICYGLFGMLGGAAFALPVLLLNLAFYWKKYVDNRLLTSKLISAVLIQLLLSAVVHVFCLAGLQNPALRELPADVLLAQGVQMRGGGLIGGGIGFFLTQYLNVVGSLIVGILLLIALFFYFLGMTPHHLWARFRLYLAVKKEQSAEKAPREKKAKEEKKPSDDGEKDPEADLAPMPTPRISPDDEEHMFLPPDVSRKMREQEQPSATEATPVAASAVNPAPTAPAAPATTPAAASAPTVAPKPVTAPTAGKAPTAPTTASNAEKAMPPTAAGAMAKNRDTAVEPIFPRTQEPRPTRRIPREDRNFDLKKVFIDFDDEMPMPTRKHAPLPPEKPMPGSRPQARTAPTAGAASNAPRPATRPASAGTGASAATPVRTNAPQIGRMPNAPAPTEASRPASAVKTTSAASAPKTPTTANASKPIFRQAETSAKKDFGLSNEEFEKLEQARPDLSGKKPSADASKKAAAKPVAPKKPDTAKPITAKRYTFPPISYLHPAEPMTAENRAEIDESMRRLADALESFRVRVQEINYSCGPTVTRYEIILAPGVRVRSVTNLANDIALALRSSGGVRIEAPIPGTNAVGIEVPNKTRSTIYLRDLIESKAFVDAKSKLSACLGADIAGEPIIFDIAKMPHLLVAGTTGSGKSVCINCIIMSILYKARPDEVKLVLIDPKKVEFSIYKNIPHLMAPVVTAPKDAAGALQAAVEEMEHRFEIFEAVHVRDLKGYNALNHHDADLPPLPHMVIIIDELADLMMTAKNEVETAICRIAQKARAAGIHLIIGTQRPSVDVVTGLIKANVPSSIAFAVKSQMDSRVILDHGGAEALTGRGDMLFVPIGSMRDTRVQGAFVDDKEVERICEFIRVTNGSAVYDEGFTSKMKEFSAQCNKKGGASEDGPAEFGDGDAKKDPKYVDALRTVIEEKRASTSLLQRKLGLGYSRAAKLIDRMEAEGYISKAEGAKPRDILITPEEFLEKFVDNAPNETSADE